MQKWSLTLTVSCISSSLLVSRCINNARVGFAGSAEEFKCRSLKLKLEVLKELKPLDPAWAAEERQRLVDKFKSRRSKEALSRRGVLRKRRLGILSGQSFTFLGACFNI